MIKSFLDSVEDHMVIIKVNTQVGQGGVKKKKTPKNNPVMLLHFDKLTTMPLCKCCIENYPHHNIRSSVVPF